MLGHVFKNEQLLQEALTHPSFKQKISNQRLEFLGDSVLGLVIAELLYVKYPNEQEGDLARRQAALVCGDALVQVATKIGLGEHILMSEGEVAGGGRETASNLEDVCEALIGAIYLDGGFDAAKTWVTEHWGDLLAHFQAPPKDAKTALQEWAQARGLGLPVYSVLKSEGPAHAPEFTIRVEIPQVGYRDANGFNKRAAEQAAAKALLEAL